MLRIERNLVLKMVGADPRHTFDQKITSIPHAYLESERSEAQMHVYQVRSSVKRVTDEPMIRRTYLHAANKVFAFKPKPAAEAKVGQKRDRPIVTIPY
jgi:hypothetical protein